MKQHAQWMLFKTEQRGARLEKLPLHPQTLQVVDAHDPANWTDYEGARLAAATHGLGLAFVFTESDPFFFVDVDNCLDDSGQWSPRALELIQSFPGAEVEVSVSGRGLHIFGVGTVDPTYKVKASDGSFDLFTAHRFVAYTGNGTGDPCAWP